MKILVTGFGGSLGEAFCRLLVRDGYEVSGIDSSEWGVAQFDVPGVDKALGDYQEKVWTKFDLVIHCAAYKHVDLCEKNQSACELNNITWYDIMLKCKDGRTKVLFISTDKAVEPASFYGKTKQEGERLTKRYGGIIARLGNIKHSSGSVIPKWEQAVAEGKPLPITDPEMTRYMIDVDEAVAKIWALYQKAKPGDVIIPDMGEPLRLGDMVEQLFPGCPTEIIGARPGEKTHEKLKWDDEQTIYQDEHGEIVRAEAHERSQS